MTIEEYIKALLRLAGNALYVRIRENNQLTQPMTIRAAAEYLYNGSKPTNRTLPSELVADRLSEAWSEAESRRLEEATRAANNELRTRSFYTDVVLPTLTMGVSSYIPGMLGTTNMAAVPVAAVIPNPAFLRIFWPLAAATALGSWYTANNETPSFTSYTGYNDFEPIMMSKGKGKSKPAAPTKPATPPVASPAEPAFPSPAESTTKPVEVSETASSPLSSGSPEDPKKKGRFRRASDELRNKNAEKPTTNTPSTTSTKVPFSERIKPYVFPFRGYNLGNWITNILRFGRDWLLAGTGIDAADNIAGHIGEKVYPDRVSDANWNFTKRYTPAGFLMTVSTKEKPNYVAKDQDNSNEILPEIE